jgi:hypothetical protein
MIFAGLIGRLYGHLSQLFGWSPVGKTISLTVLEGVDTSEIGNVFIGNIIDVVQLKRSSDADMTEACPLIQFDTTVTYFGHRLDSLIGVPRHTGYGLYSLPFVSIAVYIAPVHDSEQPKVFKIEDAVAICLLSLS